MADDLRDLRHTHGKRTVHKETKANHGGLCGFEHRFLSGGELSAGAGFVFVWKPGRNAGKQKKYSASLFQLMSDIVLLPVLLFRKIE